MKANKLKLYIRKMVREEVAMAIQEVITELKKPTNSTQTIKSKNNIITSNGGDNNKHYSKNTIFNDILNETAETTDWETMGGGVYDSNRVNDVLQHSYGDMMNTPTLHIDMDEEAAEAMGVDNTPQNNNVMSNIMNKDYSKILKTSYDKDKNKAGV